MPERLARRSVGPASAPDAYLEHCPLCRGPREFAPARFDLMRCTGCGLVVSRDIWTPRLDKQLDDEWFGESWDPAASFWVRWFEAIANHYRFNRIRQVTRGGSLLEVGFGSGSFLAYMRSRGWNVQGCDLSRSVCRRAAARWSVPTHCGEVASLPTDERYDLVVMNHVLEHAQDPLELLRQLRARMKPGAYLHLAVPNLACWEAGLAGWIGYQPYHFIYFTPKTLSETVIRSGLFVDAAFTHAQFGCWFQTMLGTAVPRLRGAMRKSIRDRLGRRSGTSPVMHAYRAATALFGLASWPFRRLQERFGRGDELIVLARFFF